MSPLLNISASYIIAPLVAESHLYSKNYKLFKMESVFEQKMDNYVIAVTFGSSINQITNEELRQDCMNIMNSSSSVSSLIIKYRGESSVRMIDSFGTETFMDLIQNPDKNSRYYLVENDNTPFSFIPAKKYCYPDKKEELKEGMAIEFLTNEGIWKQKIVHDLNSSYDKMYKLLMKYKKVRFVEGENTFQING